MLSLRVPHSPHSPQQTRHVPPNHKRSRRAPTEPFSVHPQLYPRLNRNNENMVYHTDNSQRSHPKHWNTYRPAYEDHAPHQGPPTRPPPGFEHQIYNAPAFPRGQGPRTSPTLLDDTNPNRITLTARPRLTPSYVSPILSAEEEYTHYRLWPASLDDLMGRTSRAYDLVINYYRDSAGGTRWNADGIESVYTAGRFLHDDVRVLRHWKRQVAEYGGADEDMMRKIEEDVEKVRNVCEEVQSVIEETEQKPAWPIERAGRWKRHMETQEDGYGVEPTD